MYLFKLWFSLGICPGVGLQDCVVALLLFFKEPTCHGHSNAGCERVSRHSIAERSQYAKNKEQRLHGHCKHSGLTPPDRPGRADAFCGLEANFYSLKTKKTPAGGLELGDWLGCHRVTIRVGVLA